MSYIAIALNHFRAVQSWATANGAQAQLDICTFELEVKTRNRYWRLYPQFFANVDGRMANVAVLTPSVAGFIGWRPYRPTRWAPGADKLVFKRVLAARGLNAPPLTESPRPDFDYLCKWSKGSFGFELYGPYRAGTRRFEPPPNVTGQQLGELFAEQFIKGENVKAWFWGATPFFIHVNPYPCVAGDGVSTAQQLIEKRCAHAGISSSDPREMNSVWSSLAFQGIDRKEVLPVGSSPWIEYRYGRDFERRVATSRSDNRLSEMAPEIMGQLQEAGRNVAQEIRRDLPAPLLYTMDGVLAEGKIWWVEMNCNPVLPPDGYPTMFDNLFNIQRTASQEPTHAI